MGGVDDGGEQREVDLAVDRGDPHRHDHLSDNETCQLAFESAATQLADQARSAGAVAVVGIVSDFRGAVVDDPSRFDCHAGAAKSYVTLRGKLSRTYVDRPAAAAAPVAAKDEHQ